MNISKLQPIKLDSQEALAKVEKATQNQTLSTAAPRTFDPNFPMFRFETNNKHLVYIPNFYTTDDDGNKHLIRESAWIHSVTKGRQFMALRSTQGLQGLDEYGISGDSPLMKATQENWELYNIKYKQVAQAMGIDPANDVGEVLKPKRQELLSQRVVKDPDLKHYFPIVVFETSKDTKTGINTLNWVIDEQTKAPKYKIFWMEVSENTWKEKWDKVMDSLDDGDCLAGKLVSLNYNFTEDISSEKNPRRDSGKALQINIRNMKPEEADFYKHLDEQAKEWTKDKAREVIIACALLTDEQQQEIVDEVMQDVRLELAQLKNMALGVGGGEQQQQITTNQSPSDALASFGGVQETQGGNADQTQQANTTVNTEKKPDSAISFG
ncbi:hypothetical protein COF68_04975 [Bacillus toyonensis]|uniref:hypothetical protein n=1 Tax=Bacillus toyonensis TaxID=155322 RepID=UPI000BFDCE64|nr:hypothetical protein [Bacillus toyonensis]PHE64201.1 hypothetical protein COF68_04975 [Bacillus toyonensis]